MNQHLDGFFRNLANALKKTDPNSNMYKFDLARLRNNLREVHREWQLIKDQPCRSRNNLSSKLDEFFEYYLFDESLDNVDYEKFLKRE